LCAFPQFRAVTRTITTAVPSDMHVAVTVPANVKASLQFQEVRHTTKTISVRQPVTRREVVEVERVEVHEREVTTESVEVSRYVLWWWRFTQT
jgi:hypothetical protein